MSRTRVPKRSTSAAPPLPRGQVQSVKRALNLLQALADEQNGLSLAELGKRVDLHVSTTHRLLATMAGQGFVRQHPSTRIYRLGLEALRIGAAASMQFDLRDEATITLQTLAQESGELANLAVYRGHQAIYIAQASPQKQRTIEMFTRLGARVPLHCTGIGKAILANLGEDGLLDYVAQEGLAEYTANTIVNHLCLSQELEEIRACGYAVDNEERELGVRCVASAIWDVNSQVMGAISISGSSGRVTLGRVPSLGALVRQKAKELSARLGYVGPDHWNSQER